MARAKRCLLSLLSQGQRHGSVYAVAEDGGQEEHVKQTDGYTASPVITRINWVNRRLTSCSPCGRRGSDTMIEN